MKVKSCVRKKLLTSLLIGTTLSGVANSTAFALDNLSANSSVNGLSRMYSANSQYNAVQKTYGSKIYYSYTLNDYPYYIFFLYDGNLYLYDKVSDCYLTGLITIRGHKFYFHPRTLNAQIGWYNTGGHRYYFNPLNFASLQNGFHTIDGTTYLFNSSGQIMTGLNRIHGGTYYTNSVGAVVNGWYSFKNGDRYYFYPQLGGAAYTGWYNDISFPLPYGQMYFYEDGRMAKGITNINGNLYLFKPHGKGLNYYIATGFHTDTSNGNRYYFNPNDRGRAYSGWLDLEDTFYSGDSVMYFKSDKTMARGVTKIGDDYYVFTQPRTSDPNYYRAYGWYTDGYFGRGPRYYFDKSNNGKALKGPNHVIDGKHYDFNEYGVLVKGPY